MSPLLTTSLCLLLHSATPPDAVAEPARQVTVHHVMPQALRTLASLPPLLGTLLPVMAGSSPSSDDDGPLGGYGPGLRNMAIGAVLVGAGFGTLLLAGAALLTGALVAAAFLIFTPPSVSYVGVYPSVTAGFFTALVLCVVATLLVVCGVFWTGANALILLLKLNPETRDSPGARYLPM